MAHGNEVSPSDVSNELDKYGMDYATTRNWDRLQRDLHCCGGIGFNTGYASYR